VTPGDVFVIAAYSHSGSCFLLKDDPPNDTRYGATVVAPSACVADVTVPGGGSWATSW
jgi:hypothetical protein